MAMERQERFVNFSDEETEEQRNVRVEGERVE